MGKTYNKNIRNYLRNPKGFKQAVINGERKAPPTVWDDKPCNEVCKVRKIIVRMIGRFNDKDIVDKVTAKLGCERALVADTLANVKA